MTLVASVLESLTRVIDPELRLPITELGMVGDVSVAADGKAQIDIKLTVVGCPASDRIEADVIKAASGVAGVTEVSVKLGVMSADEREALRLGALLETARAQSRASGVPVRWSATATGFVVEGLPGGKQQQAWLDPQTTASTDGTLWLGPEPILAPARITLRHATPDSAKPTPALTIGTDGLKPFQVVP